MLVKAQWQQSYFSFFKHQEVVCELVTEFAKDLVWDQDTTSLNDSIYVFANQNKRLRRLVGKVDLVITDSPIILSTLYGDMAGDSAFNKLVQSTHKRYNNLNLLLERTKQYVKIGRTQTKEEAVAMDGKIETTLIKNKITYSTIKNVHGARFEITSHINQSTTVTGE